MFEVQSSKITVKHYCEKLMGVVVFAKVQGQVKFEGPRTFRLCKSADLCKKLLLPLTLRSNNIPAKNPVHFQHF